MGANNTTQSAKGIYTFTQKEEIEYTYGVAASSWEEAKELAENYHCDKLSEGDYSGGSYIGSTQMRRAKLIRKQECAAAKFTLFRAASGYSKKNEYHNCSSHDKLIVPVRWWDGSFNARGESDQEITGWDEATGCCSRCAGYIKDWNYVLIPHIPTPEGIEYSSWSEEVKE